MSEGAQGEACDRCGDYASEFVSGLDSMRFCAACCEAVGGQGFGSWLARLGTTELRLRRRPAESKRFDLIVLAAATVVLALTSYTLQTKFLSAGKATLGGHLFTVASLAGIGAVVGVGLFVVVLLDLDGIKVKLHRSPHGATLTFRRNKNNTFRLETVEPAGLLSTTTSELLEFAADGVDGVRLLAVLKLHCGDRFAACRPGTRLRVGPGSAPSRERRTP